MAKRTAGLKSSPVKMLWKSDNTKFKSEKRRKETGQRHIDQITGFQETFRSPEVVREFVEYTFKKALLHEVEDAI